MKPSQLATIFLICVVLTATVLAQNSASAQAPTPSKSTHAAKPTRAAKTASNATPGLADFDQYVLKTMKDWKVPGAAVAIVKDGKVILSKGYGLRDVKGNLPVTEETMFPIASITKSFTVATLGMRERSFLEPLVGVYQIADFKILITLRSDEVLTATLPNQKIYELDPLRGNSFALKGENAWTVDFKRDPSGKVTEFSLNQAGSSEAYKKTQ